jgi:hypothetical protein
MRALLPGGSESTTNALSSLALAVTGSGLSPDLASLLGPSPALNSLNSLLSGSEKPGASDLINVLHSTYATRTIKELVVQALLDHFTNGASAADIRDFIRSAYGKTIEPSSLRPQLHRLKADNVLTHDTSWDGWNLTPNKRRSFKLYDHPTSRRVMKELQDDPPEE